MFLQAPFYSANKNSMSEERWYTVFMKGGMMAIKQELLDILACPKCKGDIYLNEKGNGLICDACRLMYEIRDDIPIMLIDEAKPIT